jgi:hypothetical protein
MSPHAPPRLGLWLLRPFLADGAAAPLLGDLEEEYRTVILPARGLRAARRWHLRQCVLSVGPVLKAGLARPSPPQWVLALAAIGVLVAVPLRALEALRSFVLGQVPLKEGLLRSPAYVVTTVAAALLGLAAASWVMRQDAQKPRVPTWCAIGLTWLVLGMVGPALPWFLFFGSLPGLVLAAWAGGRLGGRPMESTTSEGEDT